MDSVTMEVAKVMVTKDWEDSEEAFLVLEDKVVKEVWVDSVMDLVLEVVKVLEEEFLDSEVEVMTWEVWVDLEVMVVTLASRRKRSKKTSK